MRSKARIRESNLIRAGGTATPMNLPKFVMRKIAVY